MGKKRVRSEYFTALESKQMPKSIRHGIGHCINSEAGSIISVDLTTIFGHESMLLVNPITKMAHGSMISADLPADKADMNQCSRRISREKRKWLSDPKEFQYRSMG